VWFLSQKGGLTLRDSGAFGHELQAELSSHELADELSHQRMIFDQDDPRGGDSGHNAEGYQKTGKKNREKRKNNREIFPVVFPIFPSF
jgi:hypothetical protein